ncbi:hypothetical protein DJ73_10110, partial [Halorubrum sp. Ea1]
MNYDRVHAREPSHHVGRWSVGVIESIDERDGHAVVTVHPVASAESEESRDGGGTERDGGGTERD